MKRLSAVTLGTLLVQSLLFGVFVAGAPSAAAFTVNSGDILISNHSGSNVQRLVPSTGTVTTLTTTPSTPIGLAIDPAGNLYINENNGILKLDKATNVLTTLFTGNGQREGLTLDPLSKHLFSVSFGGNLIEEVTLTGALVRTITIPGTSDLVGISTRNGKLVVSDNGTGKIFVGTTTGSTFSQVGSVSGGGGFGVDFDASNNIYANDFNTGKTIKFTPAGGGTYTASDFITGLSEPANGLSIGDDGSLTISEFGANAVSVWNSNGTLRQRYPGVVAPDELVVVAPLRQSGITKLTETATPSSGNAPLPVTFKYNEANLGTDPISGVAVAGSICGPATFQSGDVNNNGILDPGETWVFTCTHTFNSGGTFTDTGTATGTDTVTKKTLPPETARAKVTVTGGKASPRITTMASGSVRVGGSVSDSATLSGGASPTGMITFSLYGPGDTSCTTTVATKSATVAGDGTYNSGNVIVSGPGTYNWVAKYGGDAHNNTATSACGAESVVVRNPHTTLTRTPSVNAGTFTVTFSYTEKNDGTDPISNVAVSDALCSPVTFVSGDTNGNGLLDPGETWSYACTHAFIGPGPWMGTATATGIDTSDGLPAPVETVTSAVTVPCDHNITGSVPTALILGPGSWCIIDATVAGAIVINPGAAVFIGHSLLDGAISSNGATSFAMCGSTAQAGSNTLRNTTGFIVIGDPTTPIDDGCLGNTISGSLTLTSNQGGIEVIDNRIGGSLTISGNTGTGPFPEDYTTEIEGNTISGALTCNGNVPPPTDNGDPNSASSRPGAQCTGAF